MRSSRTRSGRSARNCGQGLAAVGRGDDPESVRFERVDEGLAQGRLVFDDEDRSCHPRTSIASRVNDSLELCQAFRATPRCAPGRTACIGYTQRRSRSAHWPDLCQIRAPGARFRRSAAGPREIGQIRVSVARIQSARRLLPSLRASNARASRRCGIRSLVLDASRPSTRRSRARTQLGSESSGCSRQYSTNSAQRPWPSNRSSQTL